MNKRKRIVADSNIYGSALIFGGVADEIITLARYGSMDLFVSKAILREIGSVLIKKFSWHRARAKKAIEQIQDIAHVVIPGTRIHGIVRDPDDDRILECALEAQADLIITGDKDLLILKSFRKIKIVSPRNFLNGRSPKSSK